MILARLVFSAWISVTVAGGGCIHLARLVFCAAARYMMKPGDVSKLG
jgi:hypothetical protein